MPRPEVESTIERIMRAKLVRMIQSAVQDATPKFENRHEKIWEVPIQPHGEDYGLDDFLSRVISRPEKTEAILGQIFGTDSFQFSIDRIDKPEEFPPVILLVIHQKKQSAKIDRDALPKQ